LCGGREDQSINRVRKQKLNLFLVGKEEALHMAIWVPLKSKTQSGVDRSSSSVSIELLPFKCFPLIAFLSLRMSVAETSYLYPPFESQPLSALA
jgi:hypothetical protein